MFIHEFAHIITKITAVPVEMVFFKRKTYYEDRAQKSRHLKGGALYVSNHKSFWDYLCYFFLVYFHKLRPVVSSLIYNKNPVLRFLLAMCGAIVVGEDPLDVTYIDTCVSLLRKGKKIVIFPEAHFIQGDKILPFSPSFAKIALEADVPIVPLYIDGRYHLFKRTHVVVGRRIYPPKVCAGNSMEEVNKLTSLVQKKVEYLQTICNRRVKTPLFNFRDFPMDFGRLTCFCFIYPFFRTKWHPKGDVKNPQAISSPLIIVCNHRSFGDAPTLLLSFQRRRMHILIAREVFGEPGEHPIRAKALKDIGGIKIDRDTLDIEAINACTHVLEMGKSLALFPEGHLVKERSLSPFKDGAAMFSCRVGVPVLPLYLCSSKHFLSKKHIYVGSLLFPSGKTMACIHEESSRIYDELTTLQQVALKEGREHE